MMEEPWLIEFIDRAAQAGGIAFDIGANTGTLTKEFSSRFDGVVAVEPDPRAFAILSAGADKNVSCQHAAATRGFGAVELHLRPSHLQSSLLLEHPIGGSDQAEAPPVETVGVNGLTLDYLLFVARERFGEKPVSFVKIDVEGSEGDVLAGATDPAFRRVRWLIEVHDRELEVGLELERLGYDAIDIIPHPAPKAHPKHFWIYAEPADE